MREVHARLCALYPQYTITHMPADVASRGSGGGGGGGGAQFNCTSFVANAAVYGNCFQVRGAEGSASAAV